MITKLRPLAFDGAVYFAKVVRSSYIVLTTMFSLTSTTFFSTPTPPIHNVPSRSNPIILTVWNTLKLVKSLMVPVNISPTTPPATNQEMEVIVMLKWE